MLSNEQMVKSLLKTSRIILAAIFIQASIFAFWGMQFFITGATVPFSALWPTVIFSLLGLATFAYGFRFFQNFSLVRKKELMTQDAKKRKESLLVIVVIHYLMLEFVAVLGIILGIFMQNSVYMYPFYAAYIVGVFMSLPKESWFSGFFVKE